MAPRRVRSRVFSPSVCTTGSASAATHTPRPPRRTRQARTAYPRPAASSPVPTAGPRTPPAGKANTNAPKAATAAIRVSSTVRSHTLAGGRRAPVAGRSAGGAVLTADGADIVLPLLFSGPPRDRGRRRRRRSGCAQSAPGGPDGAMPAHGQRTPRPPPRPERAAPAEGPE